MYKKSEQAAFSYMLNFPLSIVARNKLSVLVFHKVPNYPDFLSPTEINLSAFERVIDFVSKKFNVISLDDAVEGLKNGRLPTRAACITFDDGYAEWITGVVPALLKRNLHATFYIASEQLSGNGMWHERVLSAIRKAPGTSLELQGFGLPPLSVATHIDRQKTAALLEEFLKYQSLVTRESLMKKLQRQVSLSDSDIPRMSIQDLRDIHSLGFGIGAHTIRHPILSLCNADEAKQEICGVREELMALIGGSVNSFAYPNGRAITDFNADHIKIVAQAGYTSAVTTQWGTADYSTSVFQIPRFTPWGPSPVKMALQLGRNLITRPKIISLPPERPVRIMFVENGAGFGGAIVALQTLLSELNPKQFECSVVSNLPVGNFAKIPSVRAHYVVDDRPVDMRPLALSIKAARLGFLGKLLLFSVGRADDIINRLPYLARLIWLVIYFRPDIIHGNNEPSSNRESILVSKLLRRPYVQHLRGALGFSRKKPWLLKSPQFFIPVSRWLSAELIDAGVEVSRIRQIYDAVNLKVPSADPVKNILQKEFSIPKNAVVVAMIGMLVVWKGQDLFIDAVNQIGRLNYPVVFLIIGGTPTLGDKNFADYLHMLVNQYGLQNKVLFLNQRDDLPLLLQEIDIVVSASTAPEPLGLVMLEAMANECVFIAPAHGAATEVVNDGENGYLFEPGSIDSLTEKLKLAIDNIGITEAMTTSAKLSVNQDFSGERCALATSNLHRSIFHSLS